MNFAAPENLVYLWFVPLAALLLVDAHRRRVARVQRIAGVAGGVRSLRIAPGKAVFKGILLVLALTLTTLSLARPQWGFEWQTVRTTGADVIIAVDVSNSMLAADIDPSRLERAKREVIDLLNLMRGDRVGLVAFAGDAYVQCPLTEDYAAARMFINYLDTSLIPVQGTDLGKAIRTATQALAAGGPESTAGRAIILITDGEDQEGNAKAAAAEAKAKNVKLFTIGVGSREGAPIPLPAGGFKKDASGNMVVTKPDERILQEIAVDTGGVFVRSVAGDMDLQKIYSHGILQNVERGELGESRKKQWFERFQWFLAGAFLLLIGESAIRDVVFKGAGIAGGLLLLGFLGGGGRAEAGTLKDAHEAFEEGQYDKAAEGFLGAEAEHPDDPELSYNRAVSQFKQGKLEEAARGFDKAAKAPAAELKQRSLYNLGNSYAGQQKFDEAIKSYEEALKLTPEDKEAKDNLAAVKKLKEQKQQQQQQQKQDKQKQDQKQDQKRDPQDQSGSGSDQQQQQNQSGSASDQPPQQQQADQDPKDPQGQKDQQGSGSARQQQAQHGSGSDQTPQKPQDQQQGSGSEGPPQQQADAGTGSKDQPAQPASPEPQPMDKKTAELKASQEQAEQVLRSVDDQARKYLGMPKTTKKPRVLDKDW